MYLLNLLTNLLPAAGQRYAKAVYPAVGTAVAVGVLWVSTGAFDTASLSTAITGAFAALVTLLVPNKSTA